MLYWQPTLKIPGNLSNTTSQQGWNISELFFFLWFQPCSMQWITLQKTLFPRKRWKTAFVVLIHWSCSDLLIHAHTHTHTRRPNSSFYFGVFFRQYAATAYNSVFASNITHIQNCLTCTYSIKYIFPHLSSCFHISVRNWASLMIVFGLHRVHEPHWPIKSQQRKALFTKITMALQLW